MTSSRLSTSFSTLFRSFQSWTKVFKVHLTHNLRTEAFCKGSEHFLRHRRGWRYNLQCSKLHQAYPWMVNSQPTRRRSPFGDRKWLITKSWLGRRLVRSRSCLLDKVIQRPGQERIPGQVENDHPLGWHKWTVVYHLQLRWCWLGCQDMQGFPLNERKTSWTVLFAVQQQANLHANGSCGCVDRK